MPYALTKEEVVAGSELLPAFPRVVDEILTSLDDPDANLNLLVRHIERDPVLAGRIYSQANAAASCRRHDGKATDLYTAISLIGLSRVRQTAIYSCLSNFMGDMFSPKFWEHSATTGVCAQQLAIHLQQPSDQALVSGLLHDIGQLWLSRFKPELFKEAIREAAEPGHTIEAAEMARFGADHGLVGAWLAEGWSLPQPVCDAIRFHHAPDPALTESSNLLIPLVHVAEVLSNALDLAHSGDTRVTYLSERSCELLGLTWDEGSPALFGRIDAMSRFVSTFFKPMA